MIQDYKIISEYLVAFLCMRYYTDTIYIKELD